jgi:hypothetical protein
MPEPKLGLTPTEVPPRFTTDAGNVHPATIDLWEYRAVTLYGNGSGLVPELNELGAQGWEVIQVETRLEPTRVRRELLLKRKVTRDLIDPPIWNELQVRMFARHALRSGPAD